MSNAFSLGNRRRLSLSAILPIICLIVGFTSTKLQAQLDVAFTDIAEPGCHGLPGGNVRAVAVGGTEPYVFSWNDGTDGDQLTNVLAGTYSVTVVDGGGNIASRSITILEPELLMVTFEVQDCELPLKATAIPAGGVGPFMYRWSTGQTASMITVTPGIEYCVTVTDQNECGAVNCIILDYTPLEINVSVNEISCPGAEDGSLTATPIGGTAPLTYAWSNGETSQSISGLSSGSYTVTVTDAKGCSASATGNIAPLAAIEIALNGTDPVCVGDTNGSISSAVSGGTPPYTYNWSTGATTANLGALSPGTFVLTVTDANGCPAVNSITLEYQSEISIGVAPTPETCPGANDGFLTVTVNNAVSPYTYDWSNGGSTQVLTDVIPGTYSVTVTDAVGCQDVATATVNPAPDLTVEVEGTDVTICEGANGSATVSSISGVGPYTFLWSNGATTQSINNLPAGNYSVTVSTPNLCEGVGMVTIAEPPPVQVEATGTVVLCPGDETGTVSASASEGTPPYTFVWSNGETTSTIENLPVGTYTVTVTDAAGCMDVDSWTIFEAPDLTVNTFGIDLVCGEGNTGSAMASVAGGTAPFTYEWSTGATTQAVAGLGSGTYTVTATDAVGCTATGAFTIRVIDDLDITFTVEDLVCNGSETGSATAMGAGGDAPYTFAWSTGGNGASVSGLAPGTYTVTMTDANDCTVEGNVQIVEPTAINAILTPAPTDCFGASTGSIDLIVAGGTPPYTFNWSTGATTKDISAIPAGNYSVTITDDNDCFIVRNATVTTPPAILISGIVTDALCNEDENGAIDLTVSGGTPPYTFVWSTGETVEDLNNLSAGTYMVTVTDNNGCTDNEAFTVEEPPVLNISSTLLDVSCNGESDGAISITVGGGTPPYTYAWSDGSTDEDLIDVSIGTYTVIVTDANGCMISVTGTINEPPALICTITQLTDVVLGEDGSLQVEAEGGVGPYTYLWSNGATTPIIDGLNGGNYSVIVTDATGCTTTCNFNLVALAGLGDFTWEDINRDGIQDDNEPPISGVVVRLKDDEGNVIDDTMTDMNGFYSFVGLEAGTYSVQFVKPDGFNITQLNGGANDALDSDADIDMDGMTATVTLEPGEFNGTLDAGFYNPPAGAISDPCSCLNNSTTEVDGQFQEVVTIRSYPNETWTIIDQTNMFVFDSDAPPIPPIPVSLGTIIEETDEPGVYEYAFKLVDEFTYTIFATNGFDTLTYSNTCLYPVINATGIPSESVCLFSDPIPLSANPTLPGTVKFYINGEEVTEFNPGDYTLGTFELVAEFTPDDPNECIATIVEQVIIVDDCLAKIGDLVWHDQDRDGVQGVNESGIEGVKVIVNGLNESEGFMEMMTTDENGMYMFMVPPGTYKVTFEQPEGFLLTTQNSGDDDALDSDADPDMLMTQIVTVGENEMNLTLDAGFYVPPTVAIADPCTCLNNSTDESNGQFSEILTIRGAPGQVWTILENEGMFSLSSPPPPGAPIPVPVGETLFEVEPGVYEYEFLLVDEILYSTIVATNGMDTLSISNICEYPTINVEELPGENICVGDDPIPLSANPSIPGEVRFYLNGIEITELDPATLELGSYELLVEFVPDDPEECIATILQEIVINNNCLAKVGDLVWFDKNENGIQDSNENGIGGVEVSITQLNSDNPYNATTTTDQTGMYMFWVPAGEFKITFSQAGSYEPTVANAGTDDALDSDMDPVTLMTPPFTVEDGDMNLTFDAGFIRECINVTDPGAIGYDQYLCGPGNDPEPFVSLAPASGGEGELEYLWMYSNEEGPFNAATWIIIPDSNSPTYDPDVLYETTRFARCARREGCPGFLETTIVTIQVGDEAEAQIFGQSTICVGEVATYEAVGISDDAQISWNFGPGAQPASATGSTAFVKFTSFGTFTIELTVTENDCTSSAIKRIVVTNNPATCGEGFVINTEVTNESTREVLIDWQVNKGVLMNYNIEYSEDGTNFIDLGSNNDPAGFTAEDLQYMHLTVAPKMGRNYYRVKMSDGQGNEWYSNVEEVIFFSDSKLALLYPNPARNNAVLEIFESYDEDVTLELVTSSGQLIQTYEIEAGSPRFALDLTDVSSGVYLLRVRFGKTNVKALRLVKY